MSDLFKFGKYKGVSVCEVVEIDPSYVLWAWRKVPEIATVTDNEYSTAASYVAEIEYMKLRDSCREYYGD